MKKILILFVVLYLTSLCLFPAIPGQWEVGFHYSSWTVDMIAPIIEDITPDLKYYDPEKGVLHFDSNGNNLGFEVRYFPGGKNGSFSIGLSYERNNFKANVNGAYNDSDEYGNKLEASAQGEVDLKPHSFNLGFRWELWSSSRVHPYIGFGFGFGGLKGTAGYNSKQVVYTKTDTYTEEAAESWTLKELIDKYEEEEDELFPLTFFPIIHIQLGVRGEVIDNLYLLAEVAVYDGVIFRGGVAYRF